MLPAGAREGDCLLLRIRLSSGCAFRPWGGEDNKRGRGVNQLPQGGIAYGHRAGGDGAGGRLLQIDESF